jgi:hypothetical protein
MYLSVEKTPQKPEIKYDQGDSWRDTHLSREDYILNISQSIIFAITIKPIS